MVKSAEDHVDIDYIFNKKGKYKLNLFGMINKKGCAQKLLFESYFQCDNDSPKQYKRFPIDEEFAVSLKKKKYFLTNFINIINLVILYLKIQSLKINILFVFITTKKLKIYCWI